MEQTPVVAQIENRQAPEDEGRDLNLWAELHRVLWPIASLKLTVALFAMAIFIVLAGTFAQVRNDIWIVVDQYFRISPRQWQGDLFSKFTACFVWIDAGLFFPKSFFPNPPQFDEHVGIWFPKGWLIGAGMMLNLTAAHLVRFKVQAKGARLWAGWGLIAFGAAVTWLVVRSGDMGDGFQNRTHLWDQLWGLLQFGLLVLDAVLVYGVVTLPRERKYERWGLLGLALLAGSVLGWMVLGGQQAQLGGPSMRILFQLGKGLLAGLLLLAGCVMVFKKRAGIVLLHSGVALLMFSELLVGLKATEAHLSFREGETKQYTEDSRNLELAIIDDSGTETDAVTAIPASRLEKPVKEQSGKMTPAKILSDPRLPFDIEVVQWFRNSALGMKPPMAAAQVPHPATQGAGLKLQFEERKASTGTDMDSKVDTSAMWVKLIDKQSQKELGIWAMHPYLDPQSVKVGDKEYLISYRFHRTYYPFEVTLVDARKDDYLGTDTPRNYSSDVKIVDPDTGEHTAHIWMNNPLSYRGLNFYQTSYLAAERGAKEGSTLQVVSNQGWMLPYVSCMIVGVGLLWQFGLALLRFLRRQERLGNVVLHSVKERAFSDTRTAMEPLVSASVWSPQESSYVENSSQPSTLLVRLFPLAIVLIFGGYLVSKARPAVVHKADMDLAAFGRLPVVFEGRAQPYDTLARNSLLMISNLQTYKRGTAWFVKMTGPPDRIQELLPKYTEVLRSFKVDSQGRVSWSAPPEWKERRGDPLRFATLVIPGESPVELVITSLPVADPHDPKYLLNNVNRWRGQLKLKELAGEDWIKEAKAANELEQFKSHGRKVSLVKLSGENDKGPTQMLAAVVPQLETHQAIEWLLDVVTDSDAAHEHRVFRVDHPELQQLLGLERREGFLYSVNEIRSKFEVLQEHLDRAEKLAAKHKEDLSAMDRKVIDLGRKLKVYMRLRFAFDPPGLPKLPTQEEMQTKPEQAKEKMLAAIQMAKEHTKRLEEMSLPLAIPSTSTKESPLDQLSTQKKGPHNWRPFSADVLRAYLGSQLLGESPGEPTKDLNEILTSYREDNSEEFNAAVGKYQKWFETNPSPEVKVEKVHFESFFNNFSPFFYCWIIYLVVFVLTCLSWLGFTAPLTRGAFWLTAFTFLVHTYALISRIYISGRPPVTNLYSAAVFIGWACVLGGLVLEVVFKMGVGNLLASMAGILTLRIAIILAGNGDTFAQLQAVLDTQFWLATHVVCITLGYATTYVAGLLGVIYLLRGVLTKSLTPTNAQDLTRMTYGALCFALFFSFVGTVLGGLWADDSWGRFWGWDPKENGALIIVLWNALVLHARWDGMVKDRGMAVLAVLGNIAVSWSFFGVNELGIGLHSYGFTEGVLMALGLFSISQFAIAALGCLPRDMWRSSTTSTSISS